MQKRITPDIVGQVARIAHLQLSEAELKTMTRDLNEILDAFATLDRARIPKGIKPAFQPIPIRDVFREDTVKPTLGQERALANTQHKERGFFKGPRVI
jgi:aspartyl-tRNA(Asn)/glutamyl-tRNA(Gln) amidotransferase subunit C